MNDRHRLSGCSARILHQLQRASTYLNVVAAALPDDDEDPNRQFLYQTVVLMLHAFVEEYLRCVASLGTFWKTPSVRQHLGERYQDPEKFEIMAGNDVGRWAQQQVSFDDRAAKLRALLSVLVNVDPLADEAVEAAVLDFVNVRNIITHRGGWPDDDSAPTVRAPGVIVVSNVIGTSRFYRLKISRTFLAEGLRAIAEFVRVIEDAAVSDPVFRLPE